MAISSIAAISSAFSISRVGGIGHVSVFGEYLYSLYLSHIDPKWLRSSYTDVKIFSYFLLNNLNRQKTSTQLIKIFADEKYIAYAAFAAITAIMFMCMLARVRGRGRGRGIFRKNNAIAGCRSISIDNRYEELGDGGGVGVGVQASMYPLNCVHGYVNLDELGNLHQRNSKNPPRCLPMMILPPSCPHYAHRICNTLYASSISFFGPSAVF